MLTIDSRLLVRMWGTRKLGTAVCLLFGAFIVGCGHSESEPVDIESGDTCSFCRMAITRPVFASEIIAGGKVYKFDDLACLSAFKTKRRDTIRGTTYVTDLGTRQWIRYDAATIVATDVATPMGSGLVAFADSARANAFANAHPSQKAM
jgi:copper chaperone NosL